MQLSRDGMARLSDDDHAIASQNARNVDRLREENAELRKLLQLVQAASPDQTKRTPRGKFSIDIKGRGIHAPTVSATAYPDAVSIRVDDELNPELWIDIRVSASTLAQLLVGCAEQWPAVNRALVLMLEEVERGGM